MNLRAIFFLCTGLLPPVVVAASPGAERTVMIGSGTSMLPTLPAECRLVVVRVAFEDIKSGETEGDIVATRVDGVAVFHRVIDRLPDGSLVTRGDNNPAPDTKLTTAENYVGIVLGFEAPGSIGKLVVPAARRPGNG